jgi:cobalt-zinc-cadmium efflux system membrane fusion protein
VYISPQIDEHTQAIQVRVDVDNRDHLLRLGMFVAGELIYATDEEVLAVPKSAIQQLNGENVAFIQEKPGHYERMDVSLGRITEEYIEIKSGLSENDIVVTQGSFYLKSELAKESFGDGHGH